MTLDTSIYMSFIENLPPRYPLVYHDDSQVSCICLDKIGVDSMVNATISLPAFRMMCTIDGHIKDGSWVSLKNMVILLFVYQYYDDTVEWASEIRITS